MSFGTLSEVNHFGQDANSSLPQHSGNVLQDFANNGFTANNSQNQASAVQIGGINYDGRRMRNKSNVRKTVDYNASVANWLHNRTFQRDYRDRRAIQPDPLYNTLMVPPSIFTEKPVNCLCTRPIRMAMNKVKCPIFVVKWTPEGRRLITGASSGEFTLWNGLTFSFETILQAHDLAVRSMVWSHNDQWMVTADHGGYVKYWQSNMNNVKMYQIHKEPVRGLSFSPSDLKFASCSDDSTVRIWDFLRCHEEKIFRGHGADVRCVDWHPEMAIVASGSRDTQQPVKLWDVKSGTCLTTIHAHKHAIMDLKWNRNGNWLLTASRDHLLKLFDLRNISEEVQVFRGHKKEATTIAWHPIHENLFASGGSDGSIMYWMVGNEKGLGGIENAHDTMVWSLDWHPVGHIIASGSNDHTTKFWTRNRPGDLMRDRYNLNTLPFGTDENDADIDNVHGILPGLDKDEETNVPSAFLIPGIDMPNDELNSSSDNAQMMNESSIFMSPNNSSRKPHRLIHQQKSLPKHFEKAWKEGRQPNSLNSQHVDYGFSRPDKDTMADADETSVDAYHENRSRHVSDMDGYYDENVHMADNDFHGPPNFPDRQGHSEFPVDNFYQEDPSHVRNGSWNPGSRRPNFMPFGRNHFKPPPCPNTKRAYEDIDDNHQKRHFEFGEDYPRRDGNSGFGFRGRGRPHRGGHHRGYVYH